LNDGHVVSLVVCAGVPAELCSGVATAADAGGLPTSAAARGGACALQPSKTKANAGSAAERSTRELYRIIV
jgi:hypothetical protein